MTLTGTVWAPIGPSPMKENGNQDNGLVTAIAVNPNNTNVIYLGTAQGGVWRSDDAGNTWTPLFDRQLSLGIGEGLAGFSAFAPPRVLTCPEGPQRAFDRLAKPNLADLVAGAIKTFVADRAERTLRLVSGLTRNVGGRRPDCGQFGA